MAARKTRSVPPRAAGNYRRKAREFAATMEGALKDGRWNAAALNAVHAAISAVDAMLAAFAGIRSSDRNHRHIVPLLTDHLGQEGERAARHVERVVATKNLVEYEECLITESDAKQMATHVRRLMTLVEDKLGKGRPC